MIRVSDWIMRRLADEGVGHVFLLPGGGAMISMMHWLVNQNTPIACHHEQACGISAEAYGRTGNPKIQDLRCLSHNWSRATTLDPSCRSWIDSIPHAGVIGTSKAR